MIHIETFTFNAFAENTYVISTENGDCMIIDPGCSNNFEQTRLANYISEKNLTPRYLINTHCHIDHILGNKFVATKYNLPLRAHEGETAVLEAGPQVASMYGIHYMGSPEISIYLEPGTFVSLGETNWEILFTPGHSPASICLYCASEKVCIAGDVLFEGSIGRTDLPGGDFTTLMTSIRTELLTLPDDVHVYPGHGPATTIGHERKTNPFILGEIGE